MEQKSINLLDIILAKAMVGDATAAAARAKEYAEAAQEYAESIDPETLVRIADLPDITVGMADNAKQLVATVGINDNAPYLFRTSGGTADIGDRETDEIVGGTVAWNQLIDPVTSATIQSTVSVTSVNGKYTISGTATSAGGRNVNLSKRTFPVVNGHKYAVISDFLFNSFAPFITNDANTSEYFRVYSTIQIAEATFTGNARFGINVAADTTYNESGYINFVDLTVDFGSTIADYVYSLESATTGAGIAWLRKYGFFTKPYYPYNAGGLLSVKTSAHKMVGFNAWDEEWEVGSIDTNGNNTVSQTTIRSKNYIPVVAGAEYFFRNASFSSSSTLPARFYDADKNFIGTVGAAGNAIRWNAAAQIPLNARYFRFVCPAAYGTTYNNDICINLSWDGERDGEYAPYVEYNYPLDDDLELRGIAKLDANNNLYYDGDTYASDGTVTRKYGIVDMGTLNWTRSNNDGAWGEYYKFYAQVVGKAATLNMVNPKYENTNRGLSSMGDKTIRFSADYIYIRDDSYTSAAAFKTAMSGVMLVYELATPTTESADTYTNPQIVDDFGTEEYIDEREVPIPVGHNTIYSANLRAKLEMAPDSPDGDGDYIVRQTNGTNEYVPLPVSNVYQHNAVITLASNAGTVYMTYVSKLATAVNIVDIGSTDGAPTTTPIYPATGYYDSKPVVAVQFGSAPAITVYLADGTNASTTMTALADTVG